MRIYFTLFIILILSSQSLYSQNINGRLSSSIYGFQRVDSVNVSVDQIRAYQLLNFNFNKNDFSLRTYLNFETNIVTEQKDDPRLRFYNIYLEYRNIFDIGTIKLGRQPIFNSVAGGIFDGASVSLRNKDFSFLGYYGANVPTYQKLELIDDWNNNNILGGKLDYYLNDEFGFAVSYVNKNYKPADYYATRLDVNLNPIQVLIQNNSNQYSFASGEVNYYNDKLLNANLRYDYDLNFEKTSRIELNAEYLELKDLRFNLFANYREPLIRYNSIFSVFDYGNTWEVEAGSDYKINSDLTVSGKVGTVQYKDDASQRVSLGFYTDYGNIFYRKNFGYAGEMDAISIYTANSYLEGLLTPSIGLAYTNYKLSKDDKSNGILSFIGGLNVRPYRQLSFDLQGQFLNNKIYKNDLRIFFRINYWFNHNLNLF